MQRDISTHSTTSYRYQFTESEVLRLLRAANPEIPVHAKVTVHTPSGECSSTEFELSEIDGLCVRWETTKTMEGE